MVHMEHPTLASDESPLSTSLSARPAPFVASPVTCKELCPLRSGLASYGLPRSPVYVRVRVHLHSHLHTYTCKDLHHIRGKPAADRLRRPRHRRRRQLPGRIAPRGDQTTPGAFSKKETVRREQVVRAYSRVPSCTRVRVHEYIVYLCVCVCVRAIRMSEITKQTKRTHTGWLARSS